MSADSGPGVSMTFGWWCKEGRLSLDDGHPDAARAAYAQAAETAKTAEQRSLAERLLADIAVRE